MKKVFLHGSLGEGVRKEWNLNVSSPAEAIRAVNINSLGKFMENINQMTDQGCDLGVICMSRVESKLIEEVNLSSKTEEDKVVNILTSASSLDLQSDYEEIHFTPSVSGRFIFTPLTIAAVAKAAFFMVAGMLIAGIAAALFPPVKVNNNTRTTKSYVFGDRPNIRKQGGPVPVGYGMLRVGSVTSSFSRRNKFLPNSIDKGVIESYSTFVVHDLISEGPIEGFCDSQGNTINGYSKNMNNGNGDGLRFDENMLFKSMYLNDVKLMNDQGELNVILNEKVENGGEVHPIYTNGYKGGEGVTYSIDFEKKGKSPLIGSYSKRLGQGFDSDDRDGSSAFTYSVSDRDTGLISVNLASESMFHNWTDKRVRRRFIGRKVTVDTGTSAEKVEIAVRIFDGKKYVSPINVPYGYSPLEQVDQKSITAYTNNFKATNVISNLNLREKFYIGIDSLIEFFVFSLFSDVTKLERYYANTHSLSGLDGSYLDKATWDALDDDGKLKYDNFEESPWKVNKLKIFQYISSARDFVDKFALCFESNNKINFLGQTKSFSEFMDYFVEGYRIDYPKGLLVLDPKPRMTESSQVLIMLSSQVNASESSEDMFLNNFHEIMPLIKSNLSDSNLSEEQGSEETLGNDGNIYITNLKIYKRMGQNVYVSFASGTELRFLSHAARAQFGLLQGLTIHEEWDPVLQRTVYFWRRPDELISESEYVNRNSNPLHADDINRPWALSAPQKYDQCFLMVRGISTSPASIDYNFQLPYIGKGESLTVQFLRMSPEVSEPKEQQEKSRRLSLSGIRQHKTLAGKLIKFNSNCTSWIATEFDSVNFQQIPDRNYLVKLKKVAVPSNYSPFLGSCVGTWNGLFKGQGNSMTQGAGDFYDIKETDLTWTENPAWILLDILTNTRFGVGRSGMSIKDIDVWNLYLVAKFCDQMVETGFPVERPLRTFETDNESPNDKKQGTARSYLISDYDISDYQKSNTFDVFVLDEDGELLSSSDFNSEFHEQVKVRGENFTSNKGKTIAFFMEDGSVDRRIIKKFNHEERSITLCGPSFVDHTSTELVGRSGLTNVGKDNSFPNSGVKLTKGKCCVEVSYPLVEPRFSMSTLYGEQQEALDVVRELTSSFRTVLNYLNGQVSFSPENKQEPVMLFTDANVDKSGFAYAGSSKSSRVTVCKVTYVDKFDDYKSKIEYFEDAAGIEKFGYVSQDIIGLGCTSRGQAQRLARFSVVAPMLESEIVSFKCGIEGAMLLPGSIVELSDSRRFGQNVNGRVKSVNRESKVINLDKIISNIEFYDPVNNSSDGRVELSIASPKGFETLGDRASSSGLYAKMSELSGSNDFDEISQESLIKGVRRSQIVYFDGYLTKNKRSVHNLIRKYKFEVKSDSKVISSPYHGLTENDEVKFISFGKLPTVNEDSGSIPASEIFKVSHASEHVFTIKRKSVGSGNFDEDVVFRDIGFVSTEESVSGGEHFFYKVQDLDLGEVSVGATWAIRGYRNEFKAILDERKADLDNAMKSIGAQELSDSPGYYHSKYFGEFIVTKFVSNNYFRIKQSVNSSSSVGSFTVISYGNNQFGEGGLYRASSDLLGSVYFPESGGHNFWFMLSGSVQRAWRPDLTSSIIKLSSVQNSSVTINGVIYQGYLDSQDLWINLAKFNEAPSSQEVDALKNKNQEQNPSQPAVASFSDPYVVDINDYRNVGRRQYRVTSITESENGTYEIKASEYNREKFGIIEQALSLNRPSLPIPPQVSMEIPKAPSDVRVEDLTYRKS